MSKHIEERRNSLNLELIKSNLKTSNVGKQMVYYQEIGSTNDVARKLVKEDIEENKKNGAVIITDYQTKGRGKSYRKWEAEPFTNILMTVVMKKGEHPVETQGIASLQNITLLTGLVVCEVLNNLFDIKAKIKWSNDVIINDKKVSGILSESATDKNGDTYFLIGIGINVFQDIEKFSEELKTSATSLANETRKRNIIVQREIVIAEILNRLEYYYDNIEKKWNKIRKRLKDFSSTIGKRVKVSTGKKIIEGLGLDFEDDGGLMVREDSGIIKTIYSGDVEEIAWRE